MNTLSAISHLQKSYPDSLSVLADFFNGSMCRTTFTAVVAAMSERGYSQEQIKGAIAFRDILLNIAEKPEPAKPLPVKNLQEVPTLKMAEETK